MEKTNSKIFNNTLSYKLIYVFRINDEIHQGVLKVGEASVHADESIDKLLPNCELLNKSAKKRINSYTQTAGTEYELLWTELAVTNENEAFRDFKVHQVLINSRIEKETFNKKNKANEWFRTDLETVKKAIIAVKRGQASLFPKDVTNDKSPIIFRPEQRDAIDKTIKMFKNSNNMLWNAKMRFGKTLTALQVVKEENFQRTVIITHRPVVEKGWLEDFDKIFYDSNDYKVGSKETENIKSLEKSNCNYVYFLSMQDLRGSKEAGGKFDKNNEIFYIDWDFVIIDEAHEGTQTKLGKNVLKGVVKENTKILELSGTPFNRLYDYEEKQIYTWDYVMEQSAKKDWIENNYLDSNPYEELPELNIFTYHLDKFIKGYSEVEDKAFNFREFFRVWTGNKEIDKQDMPVGKKVGDFRHQDDINKFLNLLTKSNDNNYPYSTDEYREFFKHSLWMVPGVKEAKALSSLMKEHSVFKEFKIVNVAGDGDDEEENANALTMVEDAIENNPYTITLSCGKLTTGVSVKAWTAVMMLSGSFSTSASSYLQTIFRVQTPAKIDGKMKEKCYVFDFAPDRTLKMAAEAASLNTKAGSTNATGKKQMGDFVNFCPIIAVDKSEMKKYDVDKMLQQLKKAYADRVVRNGFDDPKIYNDNLLKLDGLELEKFNELKQIIGASKQTKKTNDIDMNNQGFSEEKYEIYQTIENKPKKERTQEELDLLEEKKEKQKNKNTAISILRGISIRIPLMVYGAEIDIEDDITPDNFTDIIDDESWKEFMPKGVTKEKYKEFSKYYDEDIFISAGRSIRNRARGADLLSVTERVKRIAEIFSMFKNPDKETVLTPWRVVNMHMGDCIGGYNFIDEYDNKIPIYKPRYIENTINNIFDVDKKFLEINSKTGLYPLYVAYSCYQERIKNKKQNKDRQDKYIDYWQDVLENNIYVLCRTKMARSITKRTLAGYNNNYNINVIVLENISEIINKDTDEFKFKILNKNTWKKGDQEDMKFDCIIGNPPYQENISENKDNASLGKQLYPSFIINSIKLNPQYISLITPSRWFSGNAQDRSFPKLREFIKENNHIKKIYHYNDGKEVFDNVVIKGGINYFLYEINYNDKVEFYNIENGKPRYNFRNLFEENMDIILSNEKDYKILEKVRKNKFISINTITKGRNAFGIVGKKSVVEKISNSIKYKNSIKLQCMKEIVRWTDESKVTKNIDIFNKYKIFISKSAGDPTKDKKVLGYPYIAEPKSACTDSLIPIGKFDTLDEAKALQKYIKTKFLRYMVSIVKVSQNVYQNVYQFVPIQDFTNNSDIDWSKDIVEIDKQLYEKYNLNNEEIDFIETRIKEMN